MKQSVGLIIALFALISCERTGSVLQTSPDIRVKVAFSIDEQGAPAYYVLWNSDTIVRPSALGVVMDGDSLCRDLVVEDIEFNNGHHSIDTLAWGKDKLIVNSYKPMTLMMRHTPSGRRLGVEFRAFDDAVALRYIFPDNSQFDLTDELTQINLKGEATAWWSYADFNTYEKLYQRTSLDSVSWAATPFIMRRHGDSVHVAINEAAIIDYPDMTIKRSDDGNFKVELTPRKSGIKARINAPATSPWRVVNIAKDAAGIVNSNVLLALCPAPKVDGSSYRPMTYIGIWWEFHLGTKEWKEGSRQGATTAEALRYIDFAAANNIGGVVVEGWNKGWDRWGQKGAFHYVTPATNYDLRKVAAYAKQRGVELIMHHETGADIEGYEALMDSAFILCRELGISYLKTGHAGAVSTGENHHGQQMVEHFARIVQTAAKYGIGLDLHEPIKGSGLERTYPNMMTREAVRGLEWEAWSEGNLPSHTTLLPFTRGLAGPTDYTPGVFDILYKNSPDRRHWNNALPSIDSTRVHSTLAHQLALMITIYSPLVMAADRIENYEAHPAFEFVRCLDPDYDESRMLAGEVGEYIVVARRTGNTWYIGATTNEQARAIDVDLSFLGDGTWLSTIYGDTSDSDWQTNPTAYQIRSTNVTNKEYLTLTLAAGGGAAVIVKKEKVY